MQSDMFRGGGVPSYGSRAAKVLYVCAPEKGGGLHFILLSTL